jgi:arylsulfatase A-like enzyme
MKLLPRFLVRVAGLSLPALVLLSCGGSRERGIVRLTDVLSRKDVLRSPLMSLEEAFRPVSQTVPAGELKSVTLDGRHYRGFATAAPVLRFPNEDSPEKASLSRDGTEWRYSDTSQPGSATWRCVSNPIPVEFPGAEPSPASKGWLRLTRNHPLEAAVILPPGGILFEASVLSGEARSHRPRLSVSINGRSREFVVGGSTRLQFVDTVPWGPTTVRMALEGVEPVAGAPRGRGEEFALIRAPRFESRAGLVLLDFPPGEPSPRGTFEFSYVPEPPDVFRRVGEELEPGGVFQGELTTTRRGVGAIEVSGLSRSPGGRLRFWLNGRPLGSSRVADEGSFLVTLPMAAPAGVQSLKAIIEPTKTGTGPGEVFIDSVVWRNPERTFEQPLYLLRRMDLLDSGTGDNPWGIKKKLKVRGTSWNALLAPPPSQFRVRVRIPDGGRLRLGYGLFREADESEGDGAGFEVAVEAGGRMKTLWSAYLDPFRKPGDRDVFFEDVDLAAYAGRTVTLRLLTYGSRSRTALDLDTQDRRNDLAFWVNPVVFPERASPPPGRMNVILISLDAVRVDHLGCYGYGRPTSPNIDRLAAEGAQFLNTVSQAPYTLASHMSMLTGLYPTTHRVFHYTDVLDPSLPTLADEVRGAGMLTAAFTGGGLMDARYGYALGFDEFHDRIIAQEASDVSGPLWRRVKAWLDRNHDLDFFLFLHTYQAHSPYRAPAPYGQMFLDKDAPWTKRSLEQFIGAGWVHKYAPLSEVERRNVIGLYDGGIRFVDETLIRPLVEELKRLGIYDRTLFILTADHGEEFFDHVTWGHSNTLYNELLKVPLIIKFPGGRFGGQRVRPNVRLVDIVPTVLAEVGRPRPRVKLDGQSLLPVLEGRETEDRLCLSYLPDNIFADPMPSKISLIRGRYKIILNEKFPERAYTYFSPPPPEPPSVELFDLSRDPEERHNLANERPDVARQMVAEAQAYLTAARSGGPGRKALMDKELEERLRALGYIK